MNPTIRFKLFGGIRVWCADDQEWRFLNDLLPKNVGKKQQAFLTFLLLHHDRKITPAELMEHFWSDDSKDPANSLKNMLFKIRALLRELFPEIADPILTQAGGYEWNHDLRIHVDVEEFEQFYRTAKLPAPAGTNDPELQAFDLYGGDILPGISADWLDHLNIYYRTMYIDICKSLAIRLMDESRWDETIRVCKEAYALAPEIETFTVCSMQAMTASGQPRQAIKRYEEYRDMLWDEYNLVPSSAVEQMHTLAVESTQSSADFEHSLVQSLTRPAEQGESFQCGLLVFQNIVQLELRHMARSGHPSSIAILQVQTTGMADPSPTDIRRTERTLLQTLRAGDPFTRLNMGSFALLLSGATEENAGKVMDRIQRSFHGSYPRSRAILRYRIYPLETASAD